jgi:hypothetical protein
VAKTFKLAVDDVTATARFVTEFETMAVFGQPFGQLHNVGGGIGYRAEEPDWAVTAVLCSGD